MMERRQQATTHGQLRHEVHRLTTLIREERVLLRQLRRWWWALVAVAGLLGCDTLTRIVLWMLFEE